MMSVVLPGGNGMTMRIGFDGYACACTPMENSRPKMVTVTIFSFMAPP